MNKLKRSIQQHKDFLIIFSLVIFTTVLVFRKYVFMHLLPIPSDILTGMYYPWFDYKWGYATPVPVKNTAVSDIVSIIIPWRLLAMRMIKVGTLPLWDPTILLGSPLLANFQASVFNPFNVLFFVFNEINSISLQVIIQPALMLFAAYIFLRDLKLSKTAALFGASMYAFSQYAVVWLGYISIDFTHVYFPLILLSIRKITLKKEKIWVILLSVFICLQIFSGYPLNVIFTLIVAGLYLVNLSGISELPENIFYFVTSLILGFCLSAIQLVPAFELLSNSIRGLDMVAQAGQVKFLPFNQLINFFIPDFFGNPATWNYWGVGSYDNFAFALPTVGVFTFLIFLTNKKAYGKIYIFFLYLMIGTLLYSTQNPLSIYLSNSKIFGLSSGVNTRSLFIFTFAASVYSASGFEVIYQKKIKLKQLFIPIILYSFIASLLLLLLYLNTRILSLDFLTTLKSIPKSYTSELANLLISLRNTFIPALSVFVTFFVVFLYITFPKKLYSLIPEYWLKYSFLLVIFIVALFNIVKTTDKYISFTKQELFYPSTELTDWMGKNLSFHRFEKDKYDLLFPANSWSPYGFMAPSGQNSSALESTLDYLSLINYGRINKDVYTRYSRIENINSPLVNTLDIEYFLTLNWDEKDSPSPAGKPHTWYIPQYFDEYETIKTVSVFKNEKNLGTGWVPRSIFCTDDENFIAGELVKKDYNPAEVVFMNCPKSYKLKSEPVDITTKDVTSKGMLYNVRSNEKTYLVLSNAYYPGWNAYIDGLKTRSYKANLALIAVQIPEGEHELKLSYEPDSVKIGAVLSVIGFIMVAGGLVRMRRKKDNIIKKIHNDE